MHFTLRRPRARRPYAGAFFTAFFGLSVCACGSGNAELATAPEPGSDAAAGSVAIAFDRGATLTLALGEHAPVAVTVTPPGTYTVRFAIVGDSGDASLDRDTVESEGDGTAAVQLVAPTTSGTFGVRASVGEGAAAELGVAASGAGFGAIEIAPSYAGKRAVDFWIGSVTTGATCASLTGTPPPDGPLASKSDASGVAHVLGVPAGPALVVTARAGHFAGGCVDVAGVGVSATRKVTVSISDRPIDLAATSLKDARLSLDPDATGWHDLLLSAMDLAKVSLVPLGSTEAGALLDAMQAASPGSAVAFAAARASAGWDGVVATHLAALPAGIGKVAAGWMKQGSSALDLGAGIHGSLSGTTPGQAAYLLDGFLGLAAAKAGVQTWNGVAWTGDPGDVMHLGGTFTFPPSALVAAAAEAPARAAHPAASDVPSALAEAISCSSLGAELAPSGAAFGTCDAACLASSCAQGLSTMWALATGASAKAGLAASLTVTASGPATVNDTAEPVAWTGTWIGSLTVGPLSVGAKGDADFH